MKVTAVIPIRMGSQRVKNKNMRNFGGTTLLKHKINVLKTVKEIDEIIVNTDSEEALATAKEMGVSGQRREPYFASSECTGSEYFEYLGMATQTDVFIYAPVTSPFVKPETFSSSISEFFRVCEEYDCLATVSEVKDFLWFNNKPVNYDPKNAPNSQNLPDYVAINFGCSILMRENLIRNRNIIGQKPYFMKTDEIEGIDIDTPLDFFIAEQLYIKMFVEKKSLL